MCRSFKKLQVVLLSAGRLNKCRSLPRDPMVLPQQPLQIPTPPDDLAYDAVPLPITAFSRSRPATLWPGCRFHPLEYPLEGGLYCPRSS